jgi:hypothetical protein
MSLQNDDCLSEPEFLSERTGKPESEFEPPEDAEYPHPETLDWKPIKD